MADLRYILKQLGRVFAEEGKTVTPELSQHVARIVDPFTQRAHSTTQELVQGKLLDSALRSKNIEAVKPELVSNFSMGSKRVPDWYYESLKPNMVMAESPETLGNRTLGRLTVKENGKPSIIQLNPYVDYLPKHSRQITEQAIETPSHELLHEGTFAGKDAILASPLTKSKDIVADVRGTFDVIRKFSETPRGKVAFAQNKITPYDIVPTELAADYFARHLPFTHPKDVGDLFDFSHRFAMEETAKEFPGFAKKGKEWGDAYRGVAAVGLGLGAHELATPDPVEGATLSPDIITKNFGKPAATRYKKLLSTPSNIANDFFPTTGTPAQRVASYLTDDGKRPLGNTLLPSHTNAAMSKNDITLGVAGAEKGGKVESLKIPANVMLGDPEDGLISENVRKFFGDNIITNTVKDTVRKVGELAGATNLFDSGEGARKYMESHDLVDPLSALVDIAGGSALAPGASKGFGAIQMQGFFSPLTKSLKEMRVGKSLISDRMTGEQLRNTLQSAGIKEDELVFSGVGDALEAIGKNRIGPTKMGELRKIAEEGALGFSRKDSPGIHAGYSLFSEGDPSFKNAVYSYPGVKFDEGHFGEGVVAHRRFGDKEIFTTPVDPPGVRDELKAVQSRLYRAHDADTLTYFDDTRRQQKLLQQLQNHPDPERIGNSLQLDEIQSQFYEQGSRFGHGSPKVPLATTEEGKHFENAVAVYNTPQYANTKNLYGEDIDKIKGVPEGIRADAQRYKDLEIDARYSDRSTPQGFAKGLVADSEQDKIFKQYLRPQDNSVDNAPLRGDKYVELLAKDHLRDALKSGKDAISWTPSSVQHERYYGKDALGGVKWKFEAQQQDPHLFPEEQGPNSLVSGVVFTLPNGKKQLGTTVEDMNNKIGTAATKKLLEDMQSGKTSGELEGNAKEVYQKLYDRAIPKAFEKLTGEKAREGFVKGRNGEDVKVYWIPLDKVKGKMVTPGKTATAEDTKALVNTLSPELQRVMEDNNTPFDRIENVVNYGIQQVDAYKYPEQALKLRQDREKVLQFKKDFSPKIKDLPIAQHDQVAKDFFNV